MVKNFGLKKLLSHSSRDVGCADGPDGNNLDSEIIDSTSADEKSKAAEALSSDNVNEKERENGNGNEDEDEDEDVHKMLEDMEIPDFNLSISFDNAEDDDNDNDNNDDNDNDNDKSDANKHENVDYKKRVRREEVFSKMYHPSKTEKKELQSLAKRLGVNPSNFQLTKCQTALQTLVFGNHSIILKKGLINFNGRSCDLILLTDGFISAYQKLNIFNPLESRYDTCQFWSDVEFMEVANFGVLQIKMQSGESFEICSHTDGEDLKCWKKIIERIFILSTIHGSESSSTITDLFGWQYTLFRKPAYTAAITGDMRLMGNPKNLNKLDRYNKSSPLHYAIQQEPCNAVIIDALLRAGADPNLTDGEGRSAMYYAQRNELPDIEEILEDHGGKKSSLAEIELKGELFGGVDQAARNTERRREIEQNAKDSKAVECAAKAQSAQSLMSQNMTAMIERGEKIQEMDDKARQLNEEAKQYGNLASQLKNQMKGKRWYNF